MSYINNLTDHQLINMYSSIPNRLNEALAGLSENQLDLSRDSGKWSIRQIAHHIVDCEMNFFQYDRYALADTDRKFIFPNFNPDIWAENMHYTSRPIQLELRFFSLIREYITYLCHALPNSLDRRLHHENGDFTVRQALDHDNAHALHHINQIIETRKVHGI